MKTKRLVLSVVGLGCIGLFFAAVSFAGGGAEKVELCHVPPGDPSNAHTITVSVKAAESHLANHEGDHLGACTACAEGDSCDDGNLCTADICLSGFCDNPPADCDDGNQCTTDTCDPATGCENANKSTGTPCENVNPCSINDECFVNSSGNVQCLGTGSLPLSTACDDGIDCTTDDRCVGTPATVEGVKCTGFVEDCNCFDFLSLDSRFFASPFCDNGNACDNLNVDDDRCDLGSRECRGDVLPPPCPCSTDRCDPGTGCPPGCGSAADCGAGEVCVNHSCVVGCRSDADCGAGEVCLNNSCLEEGSCNTDSDCPLLECCFGSCCLESENCGPDGCEELGGPD